jgi:hypothetical protein
MRLLFVGVNLPFRNSRIHPLKRWLFEHEEPVCAFAVRISASPGYLADVLAGKKQPKLAFIARVTAGTNGEINANDFQQFLAVVNDNAVADGPVGRP